MAKTVTQIAPGTGTGLARPAAYTGDRKRVRFNFAADNAYPTGGYAIAPGDLGFAEQIDFIDIANEGLTPQFAFWNRGTQKMQLGVMSTGAEVANGVDVHTFSCDCIAEGL